MTARTGPSTASMTTSSGVVWPPVERSNMSAKPAARALMPGDAARGRLRRHAAPILARLRLLLHARFLP